MNNKEKPLVTFGLIAYNQEQYIRDAVAGAFAQTYSPMQIILSDDGSPDKTFEIMQEMASQYQGPHQIVLNRNEPNLGIGGHINQVMNLAKGELIVIAAGDDYSLPHRTETLVNTWLKLDKKPDSLHSATAVIDEQSNMIVEKLPVRDARQFSADAIASWGIPVIGATHAWSSRNFETFGPLIHGCNIEDRAIAFRSALLGGSAYVDEVLVYYRTGGVSGSKKLVDAPALINYEHKRWSGYLVLWRQMLKDFNSYSAGKEELRNQLHKRIAECSVLCEICSSKSRLNSIWKKRSHLNLFVLKHALKLLLASGYVKIQFALNRFRRGQL